MLRVGESSVTGNPTEILEGETGIFAVLSPTGEDMLVCCPPGEHWFIQESRSRREVKEPGAFWKVTKIASWAVTIPVPSTWRCPQPSDWENMT